MAAIAVIGVVLGAARASGRRVERLNSPVGVVGWSGSGLQLADGRTVQLPGLAALPVSSPALKEATKRGVEVGEDGRVYGLVRVHHWCGNDPVREHIARVDLALLLLYLGEGTPAVPVTRPRWPVAGAAAPFSKYGWRVEEFNQFNWWRRTAPVGRPGPGESRPGVPR
jgi:hypothetical protein